jgi:hypothetical protein
MELLAEDLPLPLGDGDIPGNELCLAVGRLVQAARSADREAGTRVYARLLWPLVRKKLGPQAPACLAKGSYGPLIDRTRELIEADRVTPPASIYTPLYAGFAAAAASPGRKSDLPEAGHLLRQRDEAEVFAESLRELWPDRARLLARWQRLEAGLDKWDAQIARLPGYRPATPLLEITRERHRSPQFGPLLEHLLYCHGPEAVMSRRVRVVDDEAAGCVTILKKNRKRAVAAVFFHEAKDRIPRPKSKKGQFQALVAFDVAPDAGDPGCVSLRCRGPLKPQAGRDPELGRRDFSSDTRWIDRFLATV